MITTAWRSTNWLWPRVLWEVTSLCCHLSQALGLLTATSAGRRLPFYSKAVPLTIGDSAVCSSPRRKGPAKLTSGAGSAPSSGKGGGPWQLVPITWPSLDSRLLQVNRRCSLGGSVGPRRGEQDVRQGQDRDFPFADVSGPFSSPRPRGFAVLVAGQPDCLSGCRGHQRVPLVLGSSPLDALLPPDLIHDGGGFCSPWQCRLMSSAGIYFDRC